MKTVSDWPITKVQIKTEQDVVLARQRARQISAELGFDNQDQVRIATAVSELARNVYQYAKVGRVDFLFQLDSQPQALFIQVQDTGPGISNLQQILDGNYISKTGMGVGLSGSKKLTDTFSIESGPGTGTLIQLSKFLPTGRAVDKTRLLKLAEEVGHLKPLTPMEEIQRQNNELLDALGRLRTREEELNHLNNELSDTNRGVVALYAELDEKAASLQRANEVKTSFLSNMTHEFRTPLSSILSLTRILMDRVDGDLTSEQEIQVRYIRQSADSLLELVNDLLDLAKVEAGKVSLHPDDFDLIHLFGALRGVFKPLLAANGSVDLIFDPPEVPLMYSDESKIGQVLRNLISNALKYTEQGTVRVSAASEGSQIVIKIRDSGIGIAPEHLSHIFEDFSQIESSLQKRTKGTGLGLPLSRKLALLLGGTIEVESELGKGSVFTLRLPRVFSGDQEGVLIQDQQSQQQADLASAQKSDAQAAKVNLLVIDDDGASRYILRTLIQSYLPAIFFEAALGQEGLDKARQLKPDAIFLDLGLPDMNGFEVLRELKLEGQVSDIPVIINSARVLTMDEKDLLGQLAVGILSKERSDSSKADEEMRIALRSAGLIQEGDANAAAT